MRVLQRWRNLTCFPVRAGSQMPLVSWCVRRHRREFVCVACVRPAKSRGVKKHRFKICKNMMYETVSFSGIRETSPLQRLEQRDNPVLSFEWFTQILDLGN
ncbi:unnamed protein product [Pylaiella littoralis]